ncbi:hypothetical protein L873DRAFT_1054822 [Choiromyces venosus 120613-1]|uniref:Uncharacterized protein n=1 Tax=Choiromyces venosus 120613-1 TaxID=1336337 RepID=A0A3N4JNY9_9PEZI|nr:hypothetical protein L873DRAFT_1054822 [Choiromyces venosus 120613-1]
MYLYMSVFSVSLISFPSIITDKFIIAWYSLRFHCTEFLKSSRYSRKLSRNTQFIDVQAYYHQYCGFALLYGAIMPATKNLPLETGLPLFNKRDDPKNTEEQDINDIPPGEKLAIVIAALTLLVAMIPLFRCTRFHRWVSSFSLSSYVKKAFGITLPAPASPTTATRGSSPIPVAEILRPEPVSIHNHHTNAHRIRTLSNNFPHGHDRIPMEHDRAPRAEESLELTRPKPALTWPVQ